MTFIKLFKVNRRNDSKHGDFYLSQVSVNVAHIALMTENLELKMMLSEGNLGIGLSKDADFTNLKLQNGNELIVIGSPAIIESKMSSNSKRLLRD